MIGAMRLTSLVWDPFEEFDDEAEPLSAGTANGREAMRAVLTELGVADEPSPEAAAPPASEPVDEPGQQDS